MSAKAIASTDHLMEYIMKMGVKEPSIFERLREETRSVLSSVAGMQIGSDEGAFLSIMVKSSKAKKLLEVGVFTGYSSLAMALALPDDGKLVALDVSEEYTNIARKYWREAGVEHKVDLRLAPATESLQKMVSDPSDLESFDLAFIDADKDNYITYFDAALKLVKKGGLILIDNTLWKGRVALPEFSEDRITKLIKEFNEHVAASDAVETTILTLCDGVTVAYKK